MPTTELALDHLALPSYDVDATRRFYADVLGLPLLYAYAGMSPAWGNRRYILLAYGLGGGGQIVFVSLEGMQRPPEDDLPKDLRHYSLSAESSRALTAWKKRLRRHQVQFWEEDHGDQRSIYFNDPNGVVLEITYPASAMALPSDPAAEELIRAWTRAQAVQRTVGRKGPLPAVSPVKRRARARRR
jgi:catechol 2,3-dioxygenase-like lactoylglutathione lyase family enzyme